jgi:hypothetical protein
VCRTSASPRRIDAPSESFGIAESGGGCHAVASKCAGDATAPDCATLSRADGSRLQAASAARKSTAERTEREGIVLPDIV